jgi:solute:Na+ symporter, SSS family
LFNSATARWQNLRNCDFVHVGMGFSIQASVLTNDVYRRLLRPGASEKELVFTGRAMTTVGGGLTIGMAICLADAPASKLFGIMVTIFGGTVVPLGIRMPLGIVSRRINTRSVTVAAIDGLGLSIALYFLLPQVGVFLGTTWKRETAPASAC